MSRVSTDPMDVTQHGAAKHVTRTQTCNYCRNKLVNSNVAGPQTNEKPYAVIGS